MNNKLIFVYSDKRDALVKSAKYTCDGVDGVHFIAIDRIVKQLHPEPWPIVIRNSFSTELKDLFNGAIVVNRLFNIDAWITRSKLLHYGQHELWIHIAVMPLLNNACMLIHDVGTRGTSKSLLPLNTQWALLSDFGRNDFKVPNFVYGFGTGMPDTDMLANSMQKSVWSIFDWKSENHLSEEEKNWHKFFVDAPIGTPVICHYLGINNFWLSYPHNESCSVDHETFQRLVCRCYECFKSSMGEFLVFLEPENGIVRFYAFSPHLLNASDSEEFNSRVAKWVSSIKSASLDTTSVS
jgi:hypothetical protein